MNYLEIMNDALEKNDDMLTENMSPPLWPIIFILACPRGASTFFQQLVISYFPIGYVSNFLAKFWKAPYIGSLLEKDVISESFVSSFRSKYGHTEGSREPHEWGYFWRKWLRLTREEHYVSKDIDFQGLLKKLAAIEKVKEAPLIFDNVRAMANIQLLKKSIGNVVVVHLKRDPYFICNSIINARVERYNDIHKFYGHPPNNMNEVLGIRDPIEQIVFQVKSIIEETQDNLDVFRDEEICEIEYNDLWQNPSSQMMKFRDFLENLGVYLKMKKPSGIEKFSSRNSTSLINKEYSDKLNQYFDKYF